MLDISLMQGRLTPSKGRGIQFFPQKLGEWEREFELAHTAGISHIQWVCEPDNLLFTKEGLEAVRAVVSKTRVTVRNMDLHELLTKTDIAFQPNALFERICSGLASINGGAIELPMMEASSLLDKDAYASRVEALKRFVAVAKTCKVPVAVETDLPPQGVVTLLQEVPEVSIAYDTGNSAGLGYDMAEEIAAYGARISNIHIKDKQLGGTTVPLGEGSVDFLKMFSLLRKMHYTGAVTLQVARGEDGKEVETIKGYVGFIQHAYEKSI